MIIANDGRTAQGEALPEKRHLLAESLRLLQTPLTRLAFHCGHAELAIPTDFVSRHTFSSICELKGGRASAVAGVIGTWPVTFATEREIVEVFQASEVK